MFTRTHNRNRAKAIRSGYEPVKKRHIGTVRWILPLAGLLFITCYLLIFLQTAIYAQTFMPVKIPLLIWVVSGILFSPLSKLLIMGKDGPWDFRVLIFHSLISWGIITVFLFSWLNKTYAGPAFDVQEKIVDAGYFRGRMDVCKKPYVIINYRNIEKKLDLECGVKITPAKTVTLTLRRGLFGYEVVTGKVLGK